MINLNDFASEQKEVVIFNGGTAGKVEGASVQIVKKTANDHAQAPDYKVNYIDASGGTVNDAVYYPKDGDTDRQKQIAISRLVSLLHAISPESKSKMLPEFQKYPEAVDFLVKQIIVGSKTGKVNVFACYGTKNNPQQYLRVRKFDFVEAIGSDEAASRLKPKAVGGDWDDVMERITPTTFTSDASATDTFSSETDDETGLDW